MIIKASNNDLCFTSSLAKVEKPVFQLVFEICMNDLQETGRICEQRRCRQDFNADAGIKIPNK